MTTKYTGSGNYQPIKDRPDKYISRWGTPNNQQTRTSKSIAIAKHPITEWAKDLHKLAKQQGTPQETEHIWTLIQTIDGLPDFQAGTNTYRIDIDNLQLHAQASITRLP